MPWFRSLLSLSSFAVPKARRAVPKRELNYRTRAVPKANFTVSLRCRIFCETYPPSNLVTIRRQRILQMRRWRTKRPIAARKIRIRPTLVASNRSSMAVIARIAIRNPFRQFSIPVSRATNRRTPLSLAVSVIRTSALRSERLDQCLTTNSRIYRIEA